MKNRLKKIKIGVLTSSQAEYGAYKPLLRALSREEKIDLTIIAFGMHLKNKYDLLWEQKYPQGYLAICGILQKYIDQGIISGYSSTFYCWRKID